MIHAEDFLSFPHTSDGLLSAARTHENEVVKSESTFGYGLMRQLTTASQNLPGYGPAKTVGYDWDIDATANRYRLESISYPADVSSGLALNYGAPGGIDDALGRLTSLVVEGGMGPPGGPVATWGYMGLGRQVGMGLGNGLEMSYEGQSGGATEMMFLDSFGRVLAMHYVGPGAWVLSHEYGYDKRGNRQFRRAYSSQLTAYSSEDSWLYRYDDLSRLVRASQGELNAAGDGFASGATPETTLWDLDELGNWSAGSDGVSMRTYADTDGDGELDSSEEVLRTEHHDTNEVNEIEALVTGDAVGTNGPEPFAYDGAGNLVFDGQHFFVYDSWNRVTEVHDPGSLAVTSGNLTGQPGWWVAQYEYDALGRRVITQDGAGYVRYIYGGGPEVLAEYDGGGPLLRWYVHGQSFPDPLVMVDLTDKGQGPAGQAEYFYYLKDALGSVAALTDAAGQIVEGYQYDPYGRTTVLRPDGTEVPMLALLPTTYSYDVDMDGLIEQEDLEHLEACAENSPTDAMCVFLHDSDGDDEVDFDDVVNFLALYDPGEDYENYPTPAWVGNTRLRFDANGDGELEIFDWYAFHTCWGVTSGTNAPLCLHIFDIDANGAVDLDDYREFQRVYGGPGEQVVPLANPSRYGNPFMWTGQRYDAYTGLVHFVFRPYSTTLARFLVRDAVGVLAPAGDVSLVSGGFAPLIGAPGINPRDEYGNGFNLYQYVMSNPTNMTDPFGLDAWDEDIDNLTDDLTAHKLYVLGRLNEGAKWASIGLNTALDIAASLLPGYGIYESAQNIGSGRGGFWDYMNATVGGFQAAGAAVKVFKILGAAATWTARAGKAGNIAVDAWGLSMKVRRISKSSDEFKNLQRRARQAYPDRAGVSETHHMVPKFLGGPADGPTASIDRAYHQLITNEFRAKWPYGQRRFPDPEELAEIMEKVYRKFPLPSD